MNKKGFTLVEMLATVTLLGVLVSLAVVSYTRYVKSTRQAVYNDYEETLKAASTNYFLNNTGMLHKKGSETKVLATTLLNQNYLEDLKDPGNKNLTCNSNSYVIVTRKDDVGFNMDLEYQVCLVCSKYKSSSCK